MKFYRLSNKNGCEFVSEGTIDVLKKLNMVTFKGTTRVEKKHIVFDYVGRCS